MSPLISTCTTTHHALPPHSTTLGTHLAFFIRLDFLELCLQIHDVASFRGLQGFFPSLKPYSREEKVRRCAFMHVDATSTSHVYVSLKEATLGALGIGISQLYRLHRAG